MRLLFQVELDSEIQLTTKEIKTLQDSVFKMIDEQMPPALKLATVECRGWTSDADS